MLTRVSGYSQTNNNYRVVMNNQNNPMTFGMELAPLTNESEKVLKNKLGKFGLNDINYFIRKLNQPEEMKRVCKHGLELSETNTTRLDTFIPNYGKRKMDMIIRQSAKKDYLDIELSDQFLTIPETYTIPVDNIDSLSSIKTGITSSLESYAKKLFANRLFEIIATKDEAAKKKIAQALNK